MLIAINVEASRVEIPFWHSFAGHLGETLEKICDDFNHSQQKYTIKPVYKGSYLETLTSFVAAFRANEQPPLVQIFEIGTATMLHPDGIIKPVYTLFNADNNPASKKTSFLPAIKRYYSDKEGRLLAMPFNSSSAVLYYNKSLFKKAGIDSLPKTWPEVERVSKILIKKQVVTCGFTTTFPSWIQIETFLNWHGIPFADKDAGISRLDIKLNYQSEALHHHLKKLADWQKEGVFEYGGRDSNAVSLFSSGHCAMLAQSSGAFMGLKKMLSFPLGVSALPYWPEYQKDNGNTVIGGGAIWVVNGFDKSIYKGVSAFLSFLSSADTLSNWQRMTGYLPVTQEAMRLSDKARHNPSKRVSKLAVSQITASKNRSPGARLGFYAQIRVFNDEQVEAICAGTKTVNEALIEAQVHANYLLRRFEKNVG
jgi:sn-glycerol 3-phosphate transport system substrate-binding protein